MEKKTIAWIAAVGIVAILVAVVYFVLDPEQSRLFPRCLFLSLTGYKCPGCGSQRMLHALLHGDVTAAWRQNALLLCSLPLLVVFAIAEVKQKSLPRLYDVVTSPITVTVIVILFVVWAIVRNIFGW